MAKKAKKRSVTKKATTKPTMVARQPAGKAAKKAAPKTKAPAPSKRAVASAWPAPPSAGSTLGEHAERLRDDIQRSKLTHPDPWIYAPKARAWGERAQVLVDLIVVQGDSPAARRALEALDAEIQRDHDFQQARRLF